ncbi:MAG: putative damage-inducible protein DinB, partial [Dinoroseobacter sp.]
FHDMAGVSHRKHLGRLLLQVFNHQTNHRGQVTTILSQLGIEPGVTDLGAMLPEV